jgi:hypothetical protein
MKKQIRGQIIRIALVYVLLAALVAWQWHFVWVGINSNIYLNGLILGVFVLGSGLAFRTIAGLWNEERAFSALQEAYSDIQEERHRNGDKLWKHDRCFKPGIVFTRPKILGHIYELTMEELQRTKHMRISIATMQNLLNVVDAKMAHERGVQSYITGLLVFLGLIGTFIGLMEMVASVGGIIGGLANADAASGDAVKRLIHDLEAPLVGMATGFSSSLFGLFTSLVLGIVVRFGAAASYSIKEEFESWLANVSRLETESSGETAISGQSAGLSISPASASALLGAIRRSNHAFDRTAEMLRQLVDRQGEQADILRQTCVQLDKVASQQAASSIELAKLDNLRADLGVARGDVYRVGEALEARLEENVAKLTREMGQMTRAGEQRAATLAATRSELAEFVRFLDSKLTDSSESTLRGIDAAHRDQMSALRTLTGETIGLRQVIGATEARLADAAGRVGAATEIGQREIIEATKHLSKGQQEIGAELQELAQGPALELRAIARSVETRLATDMADVSRVLEGIARMLSDNLGQVAIQQAHMAQAVMQLPQGGQSAREMQELRQALEDGLATGLGSIAEAVEGAFRSYGEIVDRGAPASAPMPAPLPADDSHAADAERRKLQNLAAERWASLLKSA